MEASASAETNVLCGEFCLFDSAAVFKKSYETLNYLVNSALGQCSEFSSS